MSQLSIQRYLNPISSDSVVPHWHLDQNEACISFAKTASYTVYLASSSKDVQEAQRLRHHIFGSEYGSFFSSSVAGLDTDEFDRYCDHFIVRENKSGCAVGTYRVLLPQRARSLKRYYAQSGFFMTRIERQIPALAELGRSCVHPEHRNGVVIMLLWAAIMQFIKHYECTHVIGCASVSMRDGGETAAELWRYFKQSYLVDEALEAFPKFPLPLDSMGSGRAVEPPGLIRAYLKLGARICAAPSWDSDFNTADFLMLLDLSKMNSVYSRHFYR